MDFYSVLGLEQGASLAEIKRAYRRLSRKYHPNLNPGDGEAAALFRRIVEAYETLSDPERRQDYDRHGRRTPQEAAAFEFQGFDFAAPAPPSQASTFAELFAEALHPVPRGGVNQPEPGADLHVTLPLSFDESLGGGERQLTVTRRAACQACRGSGRISIAEIRCGRCHGTGRVHRARGHMVFAKACAACEGTGVLRDRGCEMCGGQGIGVRTELVSVVMPPGVRDGARIRLAGAGSAGRRGGPPGDLYVSVQVAPHRFFRREGDDLHLVVPVAIHEAALGARIEVPTPTGVATVRVPPGTQSGQRLRLRGRGAPTGRGTERGDLIVEIQLVLPPLIDERSKELLREFGRINSEDVRKGWNAGMSFEL